MTWSSRCNFFQKCKKKITSVGWSSRCKFFWNALDPTLVIFLEIQKKNSFKKNTSVGSEHQLNPTLVFFLNEFFLNFKNKNYNDWIKSFSKSKWTGLGALTPYHRGLSTLAKYHRKVVDLQFCVFISNQTYK